MANASLVFALISNCIAFWNPFSLSSHQLRVVWVVVDDGAMQGATTTGLGVEPLMAVVIARRRGEGGSGIRFPAALLDVAVCP